MSDSDIEVRFGADTSDLDRGILTANNELGSLRSALAGVSDAAVPAAEASATAMGGLTLHTAQARREVIVLGHELLSGNFARIPGSLMVLGERMGGVSLATIGWTAAIAGASYALYEFAAAGERADEFMAQTQNRMEFVGRGFAFNSMAVQDEVNKLNLLPGVSTAAARSMAQLAESSNLTGQQIQFITDHVKLFADGVGETIPKAFELFSSVLEEPLTKLKKLDEQYDILTLHQREELEVAIKEKDANAARAIAIEAITQRLSQMQDKQTNLQKATRDFTQAWNDLTTAFSNSDGMRGITEIIIPKMISGLASAAHYLEYIYTAKAGTSFKEFVTQLDQAKKDAEQLANIPYMKGTQGAQTQDQDAARQADADAKTQIDVNAANRAAKEELSIKAQELQGERSLETQKADGYAENVKLLADMKRISLSEEYASLEANLEAENDARMRSFDEEMALYAKDSKEYQKVLQQKELADQQYQNKKLALAKQEFDAQTAATKKAAEEDKKSMDDAFKGINSSLDSMVRGVLQGTQTMTQLFARMAGNLILSMSDAIIKMGLDWVKGQAMQVQALVAANATKTISTTAAAAEAKTAQDAASSSSIMKDAETAAAGVYSSVAQIPYVGWILAPPAAAGAFAAVAAYDSFDVGTPNVPRDMIAQIHQGEAIVPAKTAQAWRDGDLGIGGAGVESHTHFHISAMDGADVAKTLSKHGPAISAAVKSAARGGNSSIRSVFRGR